MLTHISSLFPIPIPVVVNDRVLPMAIVHLPGLRTKLVEFRPSHLSRFSLFVASSRDIRRRKEIHAVVLMVMNMDNRDEPAQFRDARNHFRETIQKPFNGIDGVATGNVVRKKVVATCMKLIRIIRFLTSPDLLDSVCECIICVHKPCNQSDQNRITDRA